MQADELTSLIDSQPHLAPLLNHFFSQKSPQPPPLLRRLISQWDLLGPLGSALALGFLGFLVFRCVGRWA
ncbi:MAG: hypothetical protein KA244_06020, partial [Deltaproteobacteria bacterium]|nr:hypothetical protein [Deltaproteobacteria bacterium]